MLVDFVVVAAAAAAAAAVAVMNESKLWYRYSRTNAPRVVVTTNIVSTAAIGEGFDSDDVVAVAVVLDDSFGMMIRQVEAVAGV
jgi:hypothetical protein